jgi:hypothetical protein
MMAQIGIEVFVNLQLQLLVIKSYRQERPLVYIREVAANRCLAVRGSQLDWFDQCGLPKLYH